MCDDHVIGLPDQSIVDVALPPNDPERKSVIYDVPFPFNIMKILSRSKRAELLFSTLIENDRSGITYCILGLFLLFKIFKHGN